jgi:hypothetical protein
MAYLWLTLAAVILAVLWFRERQRSSAIRRMAASLGFVLEQGLPRSLTLSGTGLEGISSAWNIMDGKCNGVNTVFFDCRIGQGKGSWRRTVVAAKGRRSTLGSVLLALDLTSEQSGDWTVLYKPKGYRIIPAGLMAPSEVESLLQLLGRGDVVDLVQS